MDKAPAPTLQRTRRGGGKSQNAFRTISEVSQLLDLPQHVLRFWETKFPQVEPMKRGGGRRYYRPEDVAVLERIRALLHEEGYTIKGVQKLLKKPGFIKNGTEPAAHTATATASPGAETEPQPALGQADIEDLIDELETVRQTLKKSVS